MTPIFTILDIVLYTGGLLLGWYCIMMYEATKPQK